MHSKIIDQGFLYFMSEKISLPTEKQKSGQNYLIWLFLFAIILSAAAIRFRLVDVSLERDEGEYAYAGRLILEGTPPYSQVYNMKLPGIYAAYAVILAIFGQTHIGIHLGLIFINAATTVLLFLLVKKLFGPLAGTATAAAFALLSLCQSVHGIFANAEHFVILPAMAGILLLIHALEQQKWPSLLIGAILLGIAFLMKQHGAAFIAFAGFYLFFSQIRRKPLVWKRLVAKILLFTAGVLLPFALTCFVLYRVGVFEKFWFWTFEYAREYISSVPPLNSLNYLKFQLKTITAEAILIWILAGIGLISLLCNKKVKRHCIFAISFLFFSILAVCPGFYFREHYFILLLPAVAMLAGIGTSYLYGLFTSSRSILEAKLIPVALVLAVLFHTVYQQRDFFFTMSPAKVSRAIYDNNPFPESLEIAEYIKRHTQKDDRIAVIGSEPQIYFYSNRRSATAYIYTYELMKTHPYALKMQTEMIRQIESAEPKFLIFVNINTSWLPRPGSNMMIRDWFEQYKKNYDVVGLVDIVSSDQTIYLWNDQVRGYSPRSQAELTVLQRKN